MIERACVDSDGYDLFVAGNVTGFDVTNGNPIIHFDSCINNNTMIERYCDANSIKRNYTTCPSEYTCNNGACVVVSPSPEYGNSVIEEIWRRLFGP